MAGILYAHRLQGVIRQVVVDLGITMTLSDATSGMSLKDNEALLRDTASAASVRLDLETNGSGTVAIFRPK